MDTKRWFTAAIAAGVAATAVPVHQAQADDHDEVDITAEDVPDALTHQGRLIDDEGQPITGEIELTYTLWDHPTEGAVVWQDVVDAEVDETGFYSVELGGDANPIDAGVVADGQGWLGVAVDSGDELEPRISLNAVPYALVAEEALRAGEAEFASEAGYAEEALNADFAEEAGWAEEAGSADEAEVAAGVEDGVIGAEALAEDFQLEPEHIEEATGETLGGLSCANGDIAQFDGTNWNCEDTVPNAEFAEEAAEADEADHAQTADEADFADEADVAAGVEDGAIGSEALSADFSIGAGQIDDQTLGGLSCSSGEVARFDGDNWYCDDPTGGTVTEVTATSPIASTGGTQPNISIPRADGNTSGYLHTDDYSSFSQRVEDVGAGDGIQVSGTDTSPEVGVQFGDQAGTVTEGNDPRLSDAREPEPGSDYYIQNDPSSPQNASIDIDGDAQIGDALAVDGDVDVEGELSIAGGDPQEGRVLTSDADGNASWEEPQRGFAPGTPEDVTSDRELYEWYQNDNDHPIKVYASVDVDGSSNAALLIHVNDTQEDNGVVAASNHDDRHDSGVPYPSASGAGVIVPAGHYYKVDGGDGIGGYSGYALTKWVEQDL